MVIFRFRGYFSHFIGFRGILETLMFWEYFGHFLSSRGILVTFSDFFSIFGLFFRFRGILVILEDFRSTLAIFKFKWHFGNFDYWVTGWVGVYL